MKRHLILVFAWLVGCVAPAFAASPVWNFEQDSELEGWNFGPRDVTRLTRESQFAVSGQSSLCFKTVAWKKGMAEWPFFEAKPPVTDWSAFDRLVVYITNPSQEVFHFAMFASDSKIPFRESLSYTFELPSHGYRRFVIPLSGFPQRVNRSDISIVHFFTTRPQSDLALFIDNIVLLKPGEVPPEPDAPFARQLASLSIEAIKAAEQTIAAAEDKAKTIAAAEEIASSAKAQLEPFRSRLSALREEIAAPSLTLARLNEIHKELSELPAKTERALSVIRFQKACLDAGLPCRGMLVGWATSMEKLLPRAVPFAIQASREVNLALARNEKESFQLAVLPVETSLRKVSVQATDLKSEGGAVLASGNVDCDVMGYIETHKRPPYDVSHIGWWPDPILDFLGPIDIAQSDLQSFWIRVRCPRDQTPGTYLGKLTVSAEGQTPVSLDLKVRVYSFTLPVATPLPLAITFSPEESPIEETAKDQAEWRKSPEFPQNAWRKHKLQWADFLADYYITYDSLYHRGMPDYEVLSHLHKQNRLGRFNLGYYGHPGAKPEDLEAWKAEHLPRLRAAYAGAKEAGILDHAYIYGCDEAPSDLFPLVQSAASMLKAEFPDVQVMTTTYDQSYGMQSVIKSMDAFCPLTPSFDPAKAAIAREAGKQVWWYICCGPHHPHANMFIEYPAIEGRLLMGAMAVKQRPDGFLYYQISIWNSQHPIASGPYTDWAARSWTTYHGDGSWTCVGPDGTPLPTIRLENFRDGLEDYAYARILDEIIRTRGNQGNWLSDQDREWFKTPPESVLKSMTDYPRDPSALYAWRNRIGELIDKSGAGDTNPWAEKDKQQK